MEIPKAENLEQQVFDVHNAKQFGSIALELYHFQFHHNELYRNYCRYLGKTPDLVNSLRNIPFLPISFFKTHSVKTTAFEPELIFESSGTTGSVSSRHYIKKAELYQKSFFRGFKTGFGEPGDYCIIGLLPSYLERGNSSLVYMVDRLIRESGDPEGGFYLNDWESLSNLLKRQEDAGRKTLLIGVSYALLDFGQEYPQKLNHTIIMETGGMKGRKREMTRMELYDEIKSRFGVDQVHSEYGMTELLSQAYAIEGRFQASDMMKILLRDETDPFSIKEAPSKPVTGLINVIDLANIYSCAFIATDDMGRIYPDGSFEVMGRADHSDVRGCSLMIL